MIEGDCRLIAIRSESEPPRKLSNIEANENHAIHLIFTGSTKNITIV